VEIATVYYPPATEYMLKTCLTTLKPQFGQCYWEPAR